jgi:hypothetical protein
MNDDEEPGRRIIKRGLKAIQAQQEVLRLGDPLREVRKAVGQGSELKKTLDRLALPGLGVSRTLDALNLHRQNWIQQADRWKGLSLQLPTNARFEGLNRGWLEIAKATRSPFGNIGLSLKPLFDEFNQHETVCTSLDRLGWLPHYTTPFEQLEGLADTQVEEVLEMHYVAGWAAIRAKIIEQLDTYHLDDIAKAALIEGLDAYEAGRYRSAVVLLFIEIERLTRQELHGGELGGISSVKKLQELAGEMSLRDISPGGAAGLRLYKKLIRHLYQPVKTPDELAACATDAVPNRHAAIHGLLVYGSRLNCLNTIFMADYLFQVISVRREQTEYQSD